MGFSIRLAPGLRISASSRGLRTSIGPRSARLHLGAGAPGFSTGAGPVSFYTSLGAGRGRRRPSATAYQRQLAAQATLTANLERAQHARMLAESFQRLLNLHRVDFPPARAPFAPAPAQPDRAAIHRHYLREALAGIGRWSFGERREAKSRAQEWTEAEARRQWTEACQERADLQAQLDKRWQLLCANHPDVVRETLEEAFEDNEAPSAAAGVEAGEATLVVLVPTVDGAVPDQMPTTTRAGNLTLRDLSQSDRADYYKLYVCGQALVTVREAFAVAPGLRAARVVVLRPDDPDAYGRQRLSCLLAARFSRSSLDGVHWDTADAARIVNDVSTDRLLNQAGRTKALTAIDLTDEPELAALIDAVDLDDLSRAPS